MENNSVIKSIGDTELRLRAYKIQNAILTAQIFILQKKNELTSVVADILDAAGPEYHKVDEEFNPFKEGVKY